MILYLPYRYLCNILFTAPVLAIKHPYAREEVGSQFLKTFYYCHCVKHVSYNEDILSRVEGLTVLDIPKSTATAIVADTYADCIGICYVVDRSSSLYGLGRPQYLG